MVFNKIFIFLTQDQFKKYIKREGVTDLTLVEETENINIGHNHVVEMINYCSYGDYQRAITIVEIINEVVWFGKWRGEIDLIVKVLFYSLRSCFIITRVNLEIDKIYDLRIIEEMTGHLDWVISNLRHLPSSPENRETLELSWKWSKDMSIQWLDTFKRGSN